MQGKFLITSERDRTKGYQHRTQDKDRKSDLKRMRKKLEDIQENITKR